MLLATQVFRLHSTVAVAAATLAAADVADLPSSTLSHGCTGQPALVEVEAYRGTPPELSVTRPPPSGTFAR